MFRKKTIVEKFLSCVDMEYSSRYNGLRIKLGGTPMNDELNKVEAIAGHTENLGKEIVRSVSVMRTHSISQYYQILSDPGISEDIKMKREIEKTRRQRNRNAFIIVETAIGAALIIFGVKYYFQYYKRV